MAMRNFPPFLAISLANAVASASCRSSNIFCFIVTLIVLICSSVRANMHGGAKSLQIPTKRPVFAAKWGDCPKRPHWIAPKSCHYCENRRKIDNFYSELRTYAVADIER